MLLPDSGAVLIAEMCYLAALIRCLAVDMDCLEHQVSCRASDWRDDLSPARIAPAAPARWPPTYIVRDSAARPPLRQRPAAPARPSRDWADVLSAHSHRAERTARFWSAALFTVQCSALQFALTYRRTGDFVTFETLEPGRRTT